ncbi:MAG: PAS domain-containing protein [Anaerolineae bacterium]
MAKRLALLRAPEAQRPEPQPSQRNRYWTLSILIILALLPLAALGVGLSCEYLRDQRAEAGQALLQWSRVAADAAAHFVRETHHLLTGVGARAVALRNDPDAARALLARTLDAHPQYINIWATDAAGYTYADPSAPAGAAPVYAGDRPYFREAMATGAPSYQTLVVRDAGRRWVLVILAVPLHDSSGAPAGTMAAVVDPAEVARLRPALGLPPQVAIELVDDKGTVALDSARRESRAGAVLPATERARVFGQPEAVWEGEHRGQTAVVAHCLVPGTPWTAVAYQQHGYALARWNRQLTLMGLLVFSGVGVSLLLGGHAGRRASACQRQREEALTLQREADERAAQFQAMLSAISDAVFVLDEESRVVFMNEGVPRLLGLEASREAMERLASVVPVIELYDRDGTLIPVEELPSARALRGETIRGEEVRYRGLEGGPLRWARLSSAPVRDREARIIGAVTTIADTTAEKEAQAERERLLAEVQAAREHLTAILEQSPDALIVLDSSFRVRLSSTMANAFFGGPLTDANLMDLIGRVRMEAPDGHAIVPEELPLPQLAAGEPVRGLEYRVRFPDGLQRDFIINAQPILEPAGQRRLAGVIIVGTDVTAQRQAQAERERLLAALEESRNRLETILNQLPDAVFVVDTDHRITLHNDIARAYFGETMVGRALHQVAEQVQMRFSEANLTPAQYPMMRALAGETVHGEPMSLDTADGRHYELLVSAAPLRGSDGAIAGAAITATDITAMRQAQSERERLLAEVRTAEERLSTILKQLPDVVIAFDRQGHIDLANEVANRLFGNGLAGLTIQEASVHLALEMPPGTLLAPERFPIERALRGETVRAEELGVRLADGSQRMFLLTVAPLYGADGEREPAGGLLTATDITAMRQAQSERERLLAEVERARAELQAIIDRIPEGIVVADKNLSLLMSNETMRRWAGRDLKGAPVPAVWQEVGYRSANGSPFAPGQTPLERALRGETVTGVEIAGQTPLSGPLDLLESVAPVRGPDGTVQEAVVVLTDITPLKQLDRAKDEFISVAAHELRTPLTSLKGHAQILLRRARQAGWAEGDQRSLRTIDEQVDRLNELIGRLLDVSRIRLGRLQLHCQPTDLVSLARQVCEELQVTTEAHQIACDSDRPELICDCDPAAMRQVLTNLVGNAIRHTLGGRILTRVALVREQALVSVRDQGPGIPPDRLERLFEAFAPGISPQARKEGGLGLGLYISRGIVEAHGGCIWVESEMGVGTTFSFTLPLERGNGPE